ncbi:MULTISPECIES: hypothetical protein [unclassified Streptomyces]|uniref:hypothetical protein n=1 Tax=unclassified Streptomyces TaxID=2593676 RepID=UPI0036F91455
MKERQSALPQRDDEEGGAPPHRSTATSTAASPSSACPGTGTESHCGVRAGPLVGTPRDLQPRGSAGARLLNGPPPADAAVNPAAGPPPARSVAPPPSAPRPPGRR